MSTWDEVRDLIVKSDANGLDAALGGIELDAIGDGGLALLHHAVRFGGAEIVERLIARGADVNVRGTAWRHEDFDEEDDGEELSNVGVTPLMLAAEGFGRDLPTILAALLAAGADVAAVDGEGRTAMERALDHPELLKQLLAAGADPNTIASDGHSMLTEALLREQQAPIELLEAAGGKTSRRLDVDLLQCLKYDDLDGAFEALRQGADPSFLTGEALRSAAQKGHDGLAAALLDAGAPIDGCDDRPGFGFTPLLRAAYAGQATTVALLLERGADPTLANNGITPLDYAKWGKRERRAPDQRWDEVAKLLRQAVKRWSGAPALLELRPVAEAPDVVGRLEQSIGQSLSWKEGAVAGRRLYASTPLTAEQAAMIEIEKLHQLARGEGWSALASTRRLDEEEAPLEALRQSIAAAAAETPSAWVAKRLAALRREEDEGEDDDAIEFPIPEPSDDTQIVVPEGASLLLSPGPPGAVLCALRFGGWNDAPMPQRLSMMVDHWHRRHGSEVALVDGASLVLLTATPPTDDDDVTSLAEELLAVCSEIEGLPFAVPLARSKRWSLWWD
jgi:ankyrin repeat protein